jgi:hypothetical protein
MTIEWQCCRSTFAFRLAIHLVCLSSLLINRQKKRHISTDVDSLSDAYVERSKRNVDEHRHDQPLIRLAATFNAV